MSTDQTAEIVDPIYYDDGMVIHASDSGVMHPGVRPVWTKCDRDVLDNEGFTVEDGTIEATCAKCPATRD